LSTEKYAKNAAHKKATDTPAGGQRVEKVKL
jgi:hypothetical protein